MTTQPSDPVSRLDTLQRSSRRISFTVPFRVYRELFRVANHQGRSVSNLCAHLIENALDDLIRATDIPS